MLRREGLCPEGHVYPMIALTVVLARLSLAAVFLVAGTAKLMDRAGFRQTLIDFGVPPRLAPMLTVTVPITEFVIFVAVLPTATALWGGLVLQCYKIRPDCGHYP